MDLNFKNEGGIKKKSRIATHSELRWEKAYSTPILKDLYLL